MSNDPKDIFRQYSQTPKQGGQPMDNIPAELDDGRAFAKLSNRSVVGVQFHLEGGWIMGCYYNELARPCYHEHYGIKIRDMIDGKQIVIAGKNLMLVYDAIMNQQLYRIRPGEHEGVVINSIRVEDDRPVEPELPDDEEEMEWPSAEG